MYKKILNRIKNLFGQTSPVTPKKQKQDVQSHTPSLSEGSSTASTEVKSSENAVGAPTEDQKQDAPSNTSSSPEDQSTTSTEAKSSENAVGASTEDILKKVEMIEEYLNLGEIASGARTIDYSFVKDDIVRGKLVSDHISMWRCRLGTRIHGPEFNQFCLYVHMQVEGILRYYYSTTYPKLQDLLDKIYPLTSEACYSAKCQELEEKYKEQKAKFDKQKKKLDEKKEKEQTYRKNTKGIYDIPFNTILIRFYETFSKKHFITSDLFGAIRDLRNTWIHSGKDNDLSNVQSEVLVYVNEHRIKRFPFMWVEDVAIDNNLQDEDIKLGLLEILNRANCKNINIYNNWVKVQCLKDKTPYNGIIAELEKLIRIVEIETK